MGDASGSKGAVRRAVMALALVGAAVGVTAIGAAPADAQLAHDRMVSANPANNTPQLTNNSTSDQTFVFQQVGDVMYVGGQFTVIGGVARKNIAAFQVSTGAMLAFAPQVNGQVWAIVPQANGDLIIGGTFGSVNGVARTGLARITTSGAVVTGFNANLNGRVLDAQLVNGRLIAAGAFTKRLIAVDPGTGADTGYINLSITGTVDPNAGGMVSRFAVSPAQDRLVAIGSSTTVNGLPRSRAFMVDLGGAAGTLAAWTYTPLAKACRTTVIDYVRDVDFSPDGTYFAIVATGGVSRPGDLGSTICDAAARFETSIPNPARPTWMNYTGGDTLSSVAVTGNAVYVGGHQRWLDNPEGQDFCSPGCASREGIGAIHPISGKALTWNPIRARGIGARVLYATPAGLWVGSDTKYGGRLGCSQPGGPNLDDCTGKGAETHAGIGFLPLPGGAPPANKAPAASFETTCIGLTCTVAGTASTDIDGAVVSYSWAFGDGATATGEFASHAYAAGGSRTITLTVTDDDGATAQTTRTVTVSPPATAIQFVAAAATNLQATSQNVKVPTAVASGDGMLLAVSINTASTIGEPTGVAGWTPISTVTTATSVTRMWRKVATTADVGQSVRVPLSALSKAVTMLVAYRGTSTTDPVASAAGVKDTGSKTTHATPTAGVTNPSSWAVSLWTHKDATTTALTPPPGVIARASATGLSTGRITGLLADSGGPVPVGTYGNKVATAAATSSNASMWTVILAPA